jgi:uncharacterized protein YabN with tetrapyrrole methylase and pyrophosphatase domain
MNIKFNTSYATNPAFSRNKTQKPERDIATLLSPFSITKKAKVPALEYMKGINPNNNDVFDTFSKIDDVTREINFVKTQQAWDECLMEEFEEFKIARKEYQEDKTPQNFDHMEEEMGDIFYTAASIAKDAGIDPREAFKTTNRKFFNRVNLMERMAIASEDTPNDLAECTNQQRRSFWNRAKRRLYDAQALLYLNQQNQTSAETTKA